MRLTPEDVPSDWPVQPITSHQELYTVCMECGLAWNDEVSTSLTPVPAGRCPFEALHKEEATAARDLAGRIVIEFEASFPQQVDDVVNICNIVSANIFQNSLVRVEEDE